MNDAGAPTVASADAPGAEPARSRLTPLLCAANVAALVGVLLLGRNYVRRADALATERARAVQLAADAAIIRAARSADGRPWADADSAGDALDVVNLAGRLPDALAAAEVAPEQLVSVIPDAPRPIAQTNVVLHNQRISLETIGLSQLIRLAQNLDDPAARARVAALHLRPARAGQAERWDVEIGVSQVVAAHPTDRAPQ